MQIRAELTLENKFALNVLLWMFQPDVDKSSFDVIVCNCQHLSSFAASFVVKPNSIDIVKSLDMFLKPLQNPVGLVLVCILWLLFVFASLWARRKDKSDALMVSPIRKLQY